MQPLLKRTFWVAGAGKRGGGEREREEGLYVGSGRD